MPAITASNCILLFSSSNLLLGVKRGSNNDLFFYLVWPDFRSSDFLPSTIRLQKLSHSSVVSWKCPASPDLLHSSVWSLLADWWELVQFRSFWNCREGPLSCKNDLVEVITCHTLTTSKERTKQSTYATQSSCLVLLTGWICVIFPKKSF